MKHISSRGPYLSSRKAANSASLLSPYKSCSSLHLWNDISISIVVLSLAWSNFFLFTLHFFISLLISSPWRGQWWGIFSALLLLSALCHCLHFGSDQVRADAAPVRGRGTAQYALREGGGLPTAYARKWLTILRHYHWLWLVVFYRERWILANQITASQTVDFYTADL